MDNKKLKLCSVFAALAVQSAHAVCPLCAVAAGAGVGLTRCLGIDDSITGVWLGGLLTALLMWFLTWARMRTWYTKKIGALVTFAYYVANLATFALFSWLSSCPVSSAGWHNVMVGFVLGSGVFYASVVWYEYLKKNHGGHAYFPFQKIVMPIVALIIASLCAYWLLR